MKALGKLRMAPSELTAHLVQIPLKSWARIAFNHLHTGSEMLRLGATAVVLIVVSLILYKTVELPARKLIRRGFAKMELRRERALEAI